MPQHSAPFTIGFPFIELPSVDSTNNYAMAKVHEGLAQPGMAIMAHDQTAGKGQRGKIWEAGKNQNINLSIVIRPAGLLIANQFALSATVAMAVHQFFAKYAGLDDTRIKWPNDIYWRDRKAAGILIDNVLSPVSNGLTEWKWSVIGIGININTTSFPAHLQHAVSLKQITGKAFDITSLARELCNVLDEKIHFLLDHSSASIIDQYNQVLYKKDQPVKLKKHNRVFEAIIKRVTVNGQLIIHHALEETIDFGEVEWLI